MRSDASRKRSQNHPLSYERVLRIVAWTLTAGDPEGAGLLAASSGSPFRPPTAFCCGILPPQSRVAAARRPE